MKKLSVFIIILALLGLLGWKIYERVSASTDTSWGPRGIPPIAVEVEPVRTATVRDLHLFTGTLFPRSQFMVAPKVSGRLERLLVNIGDNVRRDQLIAKIDDDEYQQQVDQAKAELEVAEARIEESRSNLDVARRELERMKALRQRDISSQSSYETAEAQFKAQDAMYRVTRSQYAQKDAALKAARIRLSYTTIKASWEGGDEYRVVGERFVDEGSMLAPNAPIVSVLENSVQKAVIYVIERDYPKIAAGQEAIVSTDAWPGKTYKGKIVRVAPILRETSRQARVEIEIPNSQNLLKPGMFARIQIEFARHDNATVVPASALVEREGEQGVFMVNPREGKAAFVPLTLGIVNGKLAEVMGPSISGQVVTLGQHMLGDGSPVILPGEKPGQPGATGPAGTPPAGGRP